MKLEDYKKNDRIREREATTTSEHKTSVAPSNKLSLTQEEQNLLNEEEKVERESARRFRELHEQVKSDKAKYKAMVSDEKENRNGSSVSDSTSHRAQMSVTISNSHVVLSDEMRMLSPPSSPDSKSKEPTPSKAPPRIFASRCMCLLSANAFPPQFEAVLLRFYRVTREAPSYGEIRPSFEHMLGHFMKEAILPPRGLVQVQYRFSEIDEENPLVFSRAPANKPQQISPFKLQFEKLTAVTVLMILEGLLTEKKILILSKNVSALTDFCESLLRLMFPFKWYHMYVPVLPKSWARYLLGEEIILPFFIGTQRSYIKHLLNVNFLQDVLVVDLDDSSVRPSSEPVIQLPTQQRTALLKALTVYIEQNGPFERLTEITSPPSRTGELSDKEIEARIAQRRGMKPFMETGIEKLLYTALHTFTSLLSRYKRFMDPTTFDFDGNRFILDSPAETQPFLRQLIETRGFSSFMEDQRNLLVPSNPLINADEKSWEIKYFDLLVQEEKKSNFLNSDAYDVRWKYQVPYPPPYDIKNHVPCDYQAIWQHQTFPEIDLNRLPPEPLQSEFNPLSMLISMEKL